MHRFLHRSAGWLLACLRLSLLFLPALLRAQAPPWTGALELSPAGDNAAATGQRMATGPNGAVYAAGALRGTATFGSLPTVAQLGGAYLARLDPATGAWQWVLPIGGSGDGEIVSLQVDPVSGNVLITGSSSGFGPFYALTFGATTVYSNSFVACASPTGQWLWAAAPTNGVFRAAVWDGAGGVYVAGSFGATLTLGSLTATVTPGATSPLGAGDGFVAHLSASQQWDALLPAGGPKEEQFTALAYDPATGTVAVGGSFRSAAIAFGPTTLTRTGFGSTGLIARARLTGAGSPAWLGALAVGAAGEQGLPSALLFDAAGQLLVLGRTFGTLTLGAASVSDYFVARLTSVSQQWAWAVASAGARFTALTSSPGGRVWVGGDFISTLTLGGQTLTSPGSGNTYSEAGFVGRLDGATGQWQEATAFNGAARWVLGLALDPTGQTLYTTGQPMAQASVAVFGGTALMGGLGAAYAAALNVTTAGAPAWRWAVAPAVGGGGYIERLARDGQGNLTVLGTFERRLTLGATTLTTTNRAPFVAQCTPAGQWRWAVALPLFEQGDTGPLLAADSAGNVYVGGGVRGMPTGVPPLNLPPRAALCVASLDPAGNWRWTAAATDRQNYSRFTANLATNAAGNPTITGFFQDSLTFGATQLVGTRVGSRRIYDSFVARVDAATGQWLWAAQVKGRGGKFAQSVAVDRRGRTVLAGIGSDTLHMGAITLPPTFGGSSSLLPFVAQLSATGQWTAAIGVTPLAANVGVGGLVRVATNDAGDVLLTGLLPGRLVRFGTQLLPGVRSSYNTPFVARLSSTPAYQWQWVRALADSLGGFNSYYPYTPLPALDGAGNAYVGGSIGGQLTLPGLPAPAGPGPAVVKLDVAGQAQWVAQNAPNGPMISGSADVTSMVVTAAGQALIAGRYLGVVQFGATTLTRVVAANGFIASIGIPLAVAGAAPAALPTTDLWPNPAHTTATLRLPAAPAAATAVRLLDGLGRPVRTVPVPAGATTVALPLTGLAPGLYFVQGAGAVRRLMVSE